MSAITQFLQMGGYAEYVWSAYAITAIVLAANITHARHQNKKAQQTKEK